MVVASGAARDPDRLVFIVENGELRRSPLSTVPVGTYLRDEERSSGGAVQAGAQSEMPYVRIFR